MSFTVLGVYSLGLVPAEPAVSHSNSILYCVFAPDVVGLCDWAAVIGLVGHVCDWFVRVVCWFPVVPSQVFLRRALVEWGGTKDDMGRS